MPASRCVLLFLLSAVLSTPSLACMNDYVPNRPNAKAIARSKSLHEQLTAQSVTEPWSVRRDRLRKQLAEGGDFRVKNDLATALAHTGQAVEAVKLLEEIEAQKPGLYFTAANLGTAYELAGDNHKALEWIRKGIERNSAAHDGTEWLHVRILEAKLAVAQDAKWLETNSILGASVPGNTLGSAASGNRGEKLTPEQVKTALIYQLHERLQFVKPPDVIVGALLLDLSDLVAHEPMGAGGAEDLLTLASWYLPREHPLMRRVIEREYEARKGQEIPPTGFSSIYGFLFTLGLVTLLVTALKRWT